MSKNDLKKSGILAIAITFILLAFWLGFAKLSLGAYNEKNLTQQFLKEDSKAFKTIVIEVGTDTVARIIVGTSSMTLTGTATYPGQPRIEYSGVTGKWTFKDSGGTETVAFGTISAAYVAAEIGSTTANYVLKNNGSSTGQLATNATLAGSTTIGTGSTITTGTSTFPGTKLGYLADATQPIEAHANMKLAKVNGVNTYIGSVTAGGVTGTSSLTINVGGNMTATSTVTADGHVTVTLDTAGSVTAKVDIKEDGTIVVSNSNHLNFPSQIFNVFSDGSGGALITLDDILDIGTRTLKIASENGTVGVHIKVDDIYRDDITLTKALLHLEGGSGTAFFLDSSTYNKTYTAIGSATLSVSQYKFGTGSVYIPNAQAGIKTTGTPTDFVAGSSTFVCDVWGYHLGAMGSPEYRTMMSKSGNVGSWSDPNGYEWMFYIDNFNNTLNFDYRNSGLTNTSISSTNTVSIANAWHHYEIDNGTTTFLMWLDGLKVQEKGRLEITTATGTAQALYIGNRGAPTPDTGFIGWLDEPRFVIGGIAHSVSFTPPTTEYMFNLVPMISFLDTNGGNDVLLSIGTTTPPVMNYGIKPGLYVDKTLDGIVSSGYLSPPSDSSHKIGIETEIPVGEEAVQKMLSANTYKFYWKDEEVSDEIAEQHAKNEFIAKTINSDWQIWENSVRENYLVVGSGSPYYDKQKMNKDFIGQYTTQKTDEWNNLLNKDELIKEQKARLGGARNIKNQTPSYGYMIDDPTCPQEFIVRDQNGIARFVHRDKLMDFLYSVCKGLADRTESQRQEIQELRGLVGK